MGYIESLMATNEEIVYRTRKHWVAPLFSTMAGTILSIVGVVAIFGMFFSTGAMRTFLTWGGLLALLVGLTLLGRALVMWLNTDYLVTNQKVMKVSGIVRKTAGGAGLEKINDVTMEQSILGRMLDYGTLVVLTAADESNLNYTVMRKPAEFRRAMLDSKQHFEQADARYIADAMRSKPSAESADLASGDVRGHEAADAYDTQVMPHPAAEEAVAGQTPAEWAHSDPALPPPATPTWHTGPIPATSASPPPLSAQDVPAMIERLAGLRDQGMLTDEEFAAKKAELLGRL